jgi:hypothetical protein
MVSSSSAAYWDRLSVSRATRADLPWGEIVFQKVDVSTYTLSPQIETRVGRDILVINFNRPINSALTNNLRYFYLSRLGGPVYS